MYLTTKSRASYYVDFFSVPVLIGIASIAEVCWFGVSFRFFDTVAIGLAAWTLIEYLVHRYLFHAVFREAHWLHHMRPAGYDAVPAWLSHSVFGILFLLCVDMAGMAVGLGVWSGLMLGYFAYILAHHTIHHRHIPRGHWLRPLFDRHALHHRGVEANFGIVTTLWDCLFRTYR